MTGPRPGSQAIDVPHPKGTQDIGGDEIEARGPGGGPEGARGVGPFVHGDDLAGGHIGQVGVDGAVAASGALLVELAQGALRVEDRLGTRLGREENLQEASPAHLGLLERLLFGARLLGIVSILFEGDVGIVQQPLLRADEAGVGVHGGGVDTHARITTIAGKSSCHRYRQVCCGRVLCGEGAGRSLNKQVDEGWAHERGEKGGAGETGDLCSAWHLLVLDLSLASVRRGRRTSDGGPTAIIAATEQLEA